MKIIILSRGPKLYSTRRLEEASSERGHDVQIVNPLACYMNISTQDPKIHYKDQVLNEVDAVIPRIGHSVSFYGCAVLRQFEALGCYTLNSSIAITKCSDKLRCHQILSQKKIPMPTTAFAHATKTSSDLIDIVGGAPLIIKLLSGTQGKGVVLAESQKAAESVIEAFRVTDTYLLVQEYIKEASHTDLRCIVVGNEIVASMKRTASDGEFRANVHQGGTVSMVKITEQEKTIAIQAAKAMGIKVGGVDLIRGKEGSLVLEVNASPGLEGIEKATGIDVAGKIIEFLEKDSHNISKEV